MKEIAENWIFFAKMVKDTQKCICIMGIFSRTWTRVIIPQIKINLIDKILIKTSLIEIPQILNVILGEMSFVWPRPPFAKEYNNYLDYYKKRLAIKPWITWLWQIRKNKLCHDFQSMYKTDLEYINEWSFFLDFKIVFLTIFKVFRK